MATVMKEAIVSKGPKVTIQDSPIPKPGPSQLLIKVVVSGTNPKDWKLPEWGGAPSNNGDDIAGYVHEVGAGAEDYGFKVGDRVAAFHEMRTSGGSFAEYAVAWAHTTFHLPTKTSFEEGASIPLAALTAAVGLYGRLELPEPWTPSKKETPLLVYGGASAVGAFVIKYARLSNIHPIIAVAGRAAGYVETLIDRSKGDTIVNYRDGDEAVVRGIREALGGKKLCHAYDATAEHNSTANIIQVLERDGLLTQVLPPNKSVSVPDTIKLTMTNVGSVHEDGSKSTGPNAWGFVTPDERELGYIHSQWYTRALGLGTFSGHPTETIPGGLAGVEKGLTNLKEGKASAVKYVYRIADTPGVSPK